MPWGSWINDLPEDHNVEQGEGFSITFRRSGTCHYVRTLHDKDMDGEVTVP
jgi:plastocyanin